MCVVDMYLRYLYFLYFGGLYVHFLIFYCFINSDIDFYLRFHSCCFVRICLLLYDILPVYVVFNFSLFWVKEISLNTYWGVC